jgi:D-amino peptidase
MIRAMVLGLMLAAVALPQSPKIVIVTDMEGVGGVQNWDEQVMPGQRRWEESRKLLIGEVNAAVAGAFDAGASRVVVMDGHDGSRSLSILEIDRRAELIQGQGMTPDYYLSKKLYDGVMFVGQHAMAGTKNALMAHSQSREMKQITINGKPVGEIGQTGAIAGYFDIPLIFLSGDAAACAELRELQPGAETVAVKRNIGKGSALSLSHERAKELIREHARKAVQRVKEFRPWKIDGPVEMKFEYYPSKDGTTKSVQVFRGATVLEAYGQWIKR